MKRLFQLLALSVLWDSGDLSAQIPTNNLAPATLTVITDTNGNLISPTNLFSANAAALSAVLTNSGSGGSNANYAVHAGSAGYSTNAGNAGLATNAVYATNAGTAAAVSGSVPAAQITGTIGTGQLGNAVLTNNGVGYYNTLYNPSFVGLGVGGGTFTGGNYWKFISTNNAVPANIFLQTQNTNADSGVNIADAADNFEATLGIGTATNKAAGLYNGRAFLAFNPTGNNGTSVSNGMDFILGEEGNGYPNSNGWANYLTMGVFFLDGHSLDMAFLSPTLPKMKNIAGFGGAMLYMSSINGQVTVSNNLVAGTETVNGNLTVAGNYVGNGISITNLRESTLSYNLGTNLIPANAVYTNGTGDFSGLSVYQIPATFNSNYTYYVFWPSGPQFYISMTDLPTENFNLPPSVVGGAYFSTAGFNNPFILYAGDESLTGSNVLVQIYQVLSPKGTNTTFNNLTATGNAALSNASVFNLTASNAPTLVSTNAGTGITVGTTAPKLFFGVTNNGVLYRIPAY